METLYKHTNSRGPGDGGVGWHIFQDLCNAADYGPIPSWIFEKWHLSDLEGLAQLDCHLVREAIRGLRKGRSCAEGYLVAEMPQELDDDDFGFVGRYPPHKYFES